MPSKFVVAAAIFLAAITSCSATVIWNELIDGDLYIYPGAPKDFTYTVHPIGIAGNDVNDVLASGTLLPDEHNFITFPDAFSFVVPSDRILTGLVITTSYDYPGQSFGGFYASGTGPFDGAGMLGQWNAGAGGGTFNLFTQLGLSPLPGGTYSMNVYPSSTLSDGAQLPGPGLMTYTVSILTQPVPEPASLGLGLAGLIVLGSVAKRARRSRLAALLNATAGGPQ